jgi:thiol-disulfide isomerase/thioredoxin
VIFLDASGKERPELRLEGFEKPAAFLTRMRQLETTSSPAGQEIAKNAADEKRAVTDATPVSASAEELPLLNLSLVDGGSLDTGSLRGNVTLINFWATWCVPCKAEIPIFNRFEQGYKSRGLAIVGISLDEEGAAKVKPFLKQNPMNYTVAIGDQRVSASFNVDDSSLPVTLLIDKQGRVRFRHVGIAKSEEFERELNQLLDE